jgi:hypothetical protein
MLSTVQSVISVKSHYQARTGQRDNVTSRSLTAGRFPKMASVTWPCDVHLWHNFVVSSIFPFSEHHKALLTKKHHCTNVLGIFCVILKKK